MPTFRNSCAVAIAFAAALSIGARPASARGTAATAASSAAAKPQITAQTPITGFTLANGMKFLLVQKPEQATVMGGWVAKVGSANERPGITGVAHFFEHMMFKGSRIIGVKDEALDARLIDEQESLQEKIRALYAVQRERMRKGEIDDPFDPATYPKELVDLEAEFAKLVEQQRDNMIKDEFDRIYTEAGASGMNATTNSDSTIYWVTLPANKLELWFWMESERLKQPVFREFYAERDVVKEERRLRVESTPTGPFDEQLNAMFWVSHPYKWDAIGWMSDLSTLSMADAKRFFDTFYAPNNITAALVGNFDAAEVRELAERYFGRIPRGANPVPDVVTLEEEQLAEKRMNAECDCQPQVTIEFHGVPFGHRDDFVFDVVAGLLNGQTGRLNKSLVLDKKIASSAGASNDSLKYAGSFALFAETQGDAAPAEVESALWAEVERLQNEPVPAEELQKVKNAVLANSFRRLQNPFFLLVQLLYFEGWGNVEYLNESAAKTLAVSAADVQRAAKRYLTITRRTVATYDRKAGLAAAEVPPELAALPPQMRQQVLAQLRQIRAVDDPAALEPGIAAMEQQAAAAPAEVRPAIDILLQAARERLAELKAAGTKKEEAQ